MAARPSLSLSFLSPSPPPALPRPVLLDHPPCPKCSLRASPSSLSASPALPSRACRTVRRPALSCAPSGPNADPPPPAALTDRDTGKLSSVDSFSKHELDSEITLKECCYRNLYADVGASSSSPSPGLPRARVLTLARPPRPSLPIDYFKVKNAQEVLLSDSKASLPPTEMEEAAPADTRPLPPPPPPSAATGGQVFLSDGLKKDYQDKEYYYEEFCYKQYKAREHSNDGASRPLPSSLQRSLLRSLGLPASKPEPR